MTLPIPAPHPPDGTPSGSNVLLGAQRGSCVGAPRAAGAVETALEQYGTPGHQRKQIAHHQHGVRILQEAGAVLVGGTREVLQAAS